MDEIYYTMCKDCEHIYHCFGREMAINIQNGETECLYLHPDGCNDFYPTVEQ